jgi:hypothetical protein
MPPFTIGERILRNDQVFIVAAEIGTKKKRAAFRNGVQDILAQCLSYRVPRAFTFWPNASDSCLQLAEYRAWTIQRKYEQSDSRSYGLIDEKIRSEYDLFFAGKCIT